MDKKERDELAKKVERYDKLNDRVEKMSERLKSIKEYGFDYIVLNNNHGTIYNGDYAPDNIIKETQQFIINKYESEIARLQNEMREI